MLIQNLLLFIISILVLVKTGSWLVKSLTKIAKFLRLSEFVISFILIGFTTSLPELSIGVIAALSNNPALVIGNIIGSNIANLTIVAGLTILFARGIKIKSEIIKKDAFHMFLVSLVPILLMLDHKLSRIDGVILLLVFSVYLYKLLRERRQFEKIPNKVSGLEMFNSFALFLVSIFLLIFSAKYVVKYASLLSIDLSLPPILIGLFFIALGTSLPELTFGISSVLKKHNSMVIGNLIGSSVANSAFILGISALIRPLVSNFALFLVSAMFMVMSSLLFMVFLQSNEGITWKDSLALIMLYILFIIVELSIKY